MCIAALTLEVETNLFGAHFTNKVGYLMVAAVKSILGRRTVTITTHQLLAAHLLYIPFFINIHIIIFIIICQLHI